MSIKSFVNITASPISVEMHSSSPLYCAQNRDFLDDLRAPPQLLAYAIPSLPSPLQGLTGRVFELRVGYAPGIGKNISVRIGYGLGTGISIKY